MRLPRSGRGAEVGLGDCAVTVTVIGGRGPLLLLLGRLRGRGVDVGLGGLVVTVTVNCIKFASPNFLFKDLRLTRRAGLVTVGLGPILPELMLADLLVVGAIHVSVSVTLDKTVVVRVTVVVTVFVGLISR